jgi:hypothetical protein
MDEVGAEELAGGAEEPAWQRVVGGASGSAGWLGACWNRGGVRRLSGRRTELRQAMRRGGLWLGRRRWGVCTWERVTGVGG